MHNVGTLKEQYMNCAIYRNVFGSRLLRRRRRGRRRYLDKTSETKLRRQIKVASIIRVRSRYCRSENNLAEMPNYSSSCQLEIAKSIHVDSKETRNRKQFPSVSSHAVSVI